MTDHAETTSASTSADQARLRKERREAKIKARGADRLNKITGMDGRIPPQGPIYPPPSSSPLSRPTESEPVLPTTAPEETDSVPPAADPEEVDISRQHISSPQFLKNPPPDDDQTMRMLAQIMNQNGTIHPSGADTQLAWRLVHALLGIFLGLYLASLGFTGRRDRLTSAEERDSRIFFWVFASSETVLLTTQLMLTKGPAAGVVMGTVLGFVPEPWSGYLSVGAKYGMIFTTVRTDMLTCIFVLGVVSWLRG